MQHSSYLLVGGNFINKGAEAMLKTVRDQILSYHPNAQIYCICHPVEKEIAKSQGFHPVTSTTPIWQQRMQQLIDRVDSKIKRLAGKAGKPYADYSPMKSIRNIPNLKAAIDVSGFAYGDKRGYLQPIETKKIIAYCKSVNARYLFMPQAWGSFKEARVAKECKEMITASDAYFTRDDISRAYVAALLEKPEKDVPLACDIAFHFPVPAIDGRHLLNKNGIMPDPSKILVGISPNMRIYERMNGRGKENEYVQSIARLIHQLGDEYQIVLIPNEIIPGNQDKKDDQFLCKLIYETVNLPERCFHIKGYYSAEEIKSIIRETDLLVASRFHSLIFGLSLGIPCMAISWSHKYRELFRLFELEEYVLEDEGSNIKDILNTFHKLQKNKQEVEAKIKAKLPLLKASNEHVFLLLKE
jgi:polysaccharide pyruvyl transferase WcaK-like protein